MNTPEQQAREMMRRLGVYRWHARDYLELANLIAERDALKAELERERMRLVACGVVAMADTPESAARERNMHPDYKSAACADVARRVDECMRLRAELAAIKQGAPSNRPAVPLTVEQIVDLVRDVGLDWQSGWTLDECEPNRYVQLSRAIEAAHGIKGV